jgi:transcriptional regulator with XRE-family HTH domain
VDRNAVTKAGTVVTVLPPSGDLEPIGELIRARRRQLGLSQADVASAVSVADQPTVTGNEVARWERGKRIPRARARRALAQALDIPVRMLDLAAAAERSSRTGNPDRTASQGVAVHAIRAALLDHGGSASSLLAEDSDTVPPATDQLRRDLADVMAAYQASRYGEMLGRLPDVLVGAHLAVHTYDGDRADEAQRILALAGQASAMVLTKLGELDLAWTAADRGLAAAQRSGDHAVLGSLCRSVVHTLQSHGRAQAATRLAEKTADNLRPHVTAASPRAASVYGTLLLAGAMAAARGGDHQTTHDYLDEAGAYAHRLGRDANHLWTAFGPTNVAIHRVATSVALDDIDDAHHHTRGVDTSRLPVERQVRYAFDLARVRTARREIDDAVTGMVAAERLAPEQVRHHRMSQQIVADLRRTSDGRRNAELVRLARRMHEADATPAGP